MSGDSTPRKRGNKRRKKDEDDGSPPLAPGDERIHVQKDSSLGGGVIAKIIFFVLFLGLLGTAAIVILEYRGTSDVDIPTEESRFGSLFAGWVDESIEKHDVSEEEAEEHDGDHEEHSEEMEEGSEEEHDDLEDLLSREIPGVTESREEEEGSKEEDEGSKEEDEGSKEEDEEDEGIQDDDEEGGEEVSGEVDEEDGDNDDGEEAEEGEGLHKEHLTLPNAEKDQNSGSQENRILVESKQTEQSHMLSSGKTESRSEKEEVVVNIKKENMGKKVEQPSEDTCKTKVKSKPEDPKLAAENIIRSIRAEEAEAFSNEVDKIILKESGNILQETHHQEYSGDTPVKHEVDEKVEVEKVINLDSPSYLNVDKNVAGEKVNLVEKEIMNNIEEKTSKEFSKDITKKNMKEAKKVDDPLSPYIKEVKEEIVKKEVEINIRKESEDEIHDKITKDNPLKPDKVEDTIVTKNMVESNSIIHSSLDQESKKPETKIFNENKAEMLENSVKEKLKDDDLLQKKNIDKIANKVNDNTLSASVHALPSSNIVDSKVKMKSKNNSEKVARKTEVPIQSPESLITESKNKLPAQELNFGNEQKTFQSGRKSEAKELKSTTSGEVDVVDVKKGTLENYTVSQSNSKEFPTEERVKLHEHAEILNESIIKVSDPTHPPSMEEKLTSHFEVDNRNSGSVKANKNTAGILSADSVKLSKDREVVSAEPQVIKQSEKKYEKEILKSNDIDEKGSISKSKEVVKDSPKIKFQKNKIPELNPLEIPVDSEIEAIKEMKDDIHVVNNGKKTQNSGKGSIRKVVENEPPAADPHASNLNEKAVPNKYHDSQAAVMEKTSTASHGNYSTKKEEDEGIEEGEEEEEGGEEEEEADEEREEQEGDEGIAEDEESSGTASQRKEEAAKVADDEDEEEEEEEEEEEDDEPTAPLPQKGRSSGEQSEPLNSEPAYEKASLTNDEDFSIRHQLDEAELEIDRDPAIAVAKFSAILRIHPSSPRAFYGRARAIDRLAAKQQSNHLLGEAIDAYISLLLLPTSVLTSNGTKNTKPVHVPDDLYKVAGEECIDRIRFRGHHHKALQVHHLLEKRFPNDPRYPIQLAVTYLMENRLQNAKDVLQGVLEKWPNSGSALVHMGFVLKATAGKLGKEEDKIKQLEIAADHLKRGIASGEEGTSDGRFYFSLGDSLVRLHRREEAEQVYEDGAKKGLFLSKFQRSLYNVNHLSAKPWWTIEETTYSYFFRKLEENWKLIRDEGLALLEQGNNRKTFKDEAEDLRDVGEWKQLDLFAQGRKIQANCNRAPKTCDLVSQFPAAASCTRGQIKFSVMMPGTHVWPHCGPTNCRLRSHLGLVVPSGVTIRVANHAPRTWKPGKFFVFDDSFEHEVWHNGTSPRLVLIVDVWHPGLSTRERKSLPAI